MSHIDLENRTALTSRRCHTSLAAARPYDGRVSTRGPIDCAMDNLAAIDLSLACEFDRYRRNAIPPEPV